MRAFAGLFDLRKHSRLLKLFPPLPTPLYLLTECPVKRNQVSGDTKIAFTALM